MTLSAQARHFVTVPVQRRILTMSRGLRPRNPTFMKPGIVTNFCFRCWLIRTAIQADCLKVTDHLEATLLDFSNGLWGHRRPVRSDICVAGRTRLSLLASSGGSPAHLRIPRYKDPQSEDCAMLTSFAATYRR
jgi:hypothetical protein